MNPPDLATARPDAATPLPLDYVAPTGSVSPVPRPRLARLGLQAAHRLGAAALLLLLGAAGAFFTGRQYRSLLLLGFVAADLALVGALAAAWRARREGRQDREAAGVFWFTAACLSAAAAGVAMSLVADQPS